MAPHAKTYVEVFVATLKLARSIDLPLPWYHRYRVYVLNEPHDSSQPLHRITYIYLARSYSPNPVALTRPIRITYRKTEENNADLLVSNYIDVSPTLNR